MLKAAPVSQHHAVVDIFAQSLSHPCQFIKTHEVKYNLSIRALIYRDAYQCQFFYHKWTTHSQAPTKTQHNPRTEIWSTGSSNKTQGYETRCTAKKMIKLQTLIDQMALSDIQRNIRGLTQILSYTLYCTHTHTHVLYVHTL